MLHAGNQDKKASLWSHEPILTPENKIWRAVLELAYLDAELPLLQDGSEPIERILARRFLRADSPCDLENLAMLCEFAVLPADRVYLMARRRYPREETNDTAVERGGLPPLFLPSQALASAGGLPWQTGKRERDSRAPKRADTPQGQVPA